MTIAVLAINVLEGLPQQASVTVDFEKGSWEVTSDSKNILYRHTGSVSTIVPNLVGLTTASGQQVLHLEGLNPKSLRRGDEGSGLLFNLSGLKFAIGWSITRAE